MERCMHGLRLWPTINPGSESRASVMWDPSPHSAFPIPLLRGMVWDSPRLPLPPLEMKGHTVLPSTDLWMCCPGGPCLFFSLSKEKEVLASGHHHPPLRMPTYVSARVYICAVFCVWHLCVHISKCLSICMYVCMYLHIFRCRGRSLCARGHLLCP